ncbi:ABC-2 family transporter [Streptomyces sp. Ag109_O5-1]|uniref:ABC transporter permease n=1 Tax=Streptomyces sp. Ag109_O5-1 TaxID=1938851 RepID=UPI000F4E15AF|nr:ABC transporter permease [Streptomyces sp. Ag109_O5-1]RPE38683.1 ABC-2 family transporter [Streptomyces sp. Ag109_O5-1]
MTTLSTPPAKATRHGAGKPALWRDLLGAEWIKLWSLRSTPIVLGVLLSLYLYLAYHAAQLDHDSYPTWPAFAKLDPDPAHDAFDFPKFLLLMATAGTIGAMSVVGEHASGLIRATLIAVPARGRVILAKATVVTAVLAVLGLLIGVGGWGITLAVISDRISGFSFTTPGIWRLIAGTTVMVPVCGLIGMATATLIRNTAGSVFAVLAFFLVGPLAVKARLPLLSDDQRADLGNTLPAYAWGRLKTMSHGHLVERVSSIPAAWISLTVWAVVSVVITVTVLRRRDV